MPCFSVPRFYLALHQPSWCSQLQLPTRIYRAARCLVLSYTALRLHLNVQVQLLPYLNIDHNLDITRSPNMYVNIAVQYLALPIHSLFALPYLVCPYVPYVYLA